MSDYALLLPAGAYIESSTVAAIDRATLGCTMELLGDRLAAPGANASAGTFFEAIAGYWRLKSYDSGTANLLLDNNSIQSGTFTASIAEASIGATRWYRIRAWHDTTQGSNKQGVELWDDTDTLIASVYGNDANAFPAPTGFQYIRWNNSGGVASTSALEVRWLAVWDGKPPAGAPTLPIAGASGLLDAWPCDEGAGNTVTGVNGTVLPITDGGTAHSWVLVSGGSVPVLLFLPDEDSCMSDVFQKDATSKSVEVFVQDATTGLGLTGLAYNTSGLTAYYRRRGAASVAITLATQTVTGAWSSGGFVEVDATHLPGVYRLDLPNAALVTGVDALTVGLVATGGAHRPQAVDLTAYDPTTIDKTGFALASTGLNSIVGYSP